MSATEGEALKMRPIKRQRTEAVSSSSINDSLDQREQQELANPSNPAYNQVRSDFSGHIHARGNVTQVGNIGGDAFFNQTTINERKAFFDWLSPSIDADKDHEIILGKRYLQTGEWVLRRDQFQQWYRSGSSQLLWCWGAPGAGKSVLASIVLDYIQSNAPSNQGIGLAFIYFKYDSPECQQTKNILALFIKQLCYDLKEVPEHLLKFYKKFHYNSRFPNIRQYLSELQTLIRRYQEVFVIIDALDEFNRKDRESFIDILQELTSSLPSVKIFITSRRESDIKTALAIYQTPVIQMEARDIGKDIDVFVRGRMEEWKRSPTPYLPSKDLRAKVLLRLVEQANGMFLWVDLQFKILREQKRDRDVEDELRRLPKDLDATYHRIIDQINHKTPQLQLLAKNILTWVFYAERSLTIDELVEAVAIDDNCTTWQELRQNKYPKDTIFEVCSNLLTEESDIVRPIHYSVREYFTKSQSYDGTGLLSSLSNHDTAYAHLAECCISYIMLDTFAAGPCSNKIDLDERVSTYPLAAHSTYLFDRYIIQSGSLPSNLKESLDKLLSSSERSLASILQLRKLRDNINWNNIQASFSDFQDAVLPEDVIYATTLYNSTQLQSVNDRWKTIEAPRYALHRAAEAGILDAITPLLEAGHHISEEDSHSITPLYYASEGGYTTICVLLVEHGADINAQGGHYGNALQAALVGGHQAVVELLLTKGADVHAQGGIYSNALQAASDRGHQAVVELLLTKGANVHAQGGLYGNALQAASVGGHQAVVELLLAKGADVNA